MCYLVAKDINKSGCVALKIKHGSHLVELKHRLIQMAGIGRIQFVTISRPEAYYEYAPYSMVNSDEEFERAVEIMLGS